MAGKFTSPPPPPCVVKRRCQRRNRFLFFLCTRRYVCPRKSSDTITSPLVVEQNRLFSTSLTRGLTTLCPEICKALLLYIKVLSEPSSYLWTEWHVTESVVEYRVLPCATMTITRQKTKRSTTVVFHVNDTMSRSQSIKTINCDEVMLQPM